MSWITRKDAYYALVGLAISSVFYFESVVPANKEIQNLKKEKAMLQIGLIDEIVGLNNRDFNFIKDGVINEDMMLLIRPHLERAVKYTNKTKKYEAMLTDSVFTFE